MLVDEDLPNFFDSLNLSSAKELDLENENMKWNFGFETTDPDTIANLKNISMPIKEMQGTPWYQVLSNPNYSQAFFYIGAFIEEREKLIEDGTERDYVVIKEQTAQGVKQIKEVCNECKCKRHEQSDMVMILLNLSYIPDDVVKNLDFDPGWQKRFHAIMRSYKEYFQQQMRRQWCFQNKELEEEYSKYIKFKQRKDEDWLWATKECDATERKLWKRKKAKK